MGAIEYNWDPTITSEARCDIIRAYAVLYRMNNFVETGSADGDTCLALQGTFAKMYTIEIVPTVQRRTAQRLSVYPEIECFLGDSAEILPGLLARINEPCLFWLDGHYCGSLEARAEKDTPVKEEIEIILQTGLPHLILIDDSRLFGTDPAYPTVEWVRDIATHQRIEFKFSYADDIMRIVPT